MTQKTDPRPKCPGCGDRMDVCVFRNHYKENWEAHYKCFNKSCAAQWRTAPAIGQTKEEAKEKARLIAMVRRRGCA